MLRDQGYQAIVANITQSETLRGLPETEIVLYCVGFDRSPRSTIHQVYASGMGHLLPSLPTSATPRLIYISTTGVYTPAESVKTTGAWIDEHQPTQPHRPGAQASLAAEQQLAGHPLGRRAVILRMAGLYGPGHIAQLEKIRAGLPLAVLSTGWLNLIHVDDGASAVLAAGAWPASISQGPEIFNVADGCPVVRSDYYREVARQVGAPIPRFTTPDTNLPATARAATSKRISSEKLRGTLGLKLAYPSYREGLAAILATRGC